MEQQITRFVIPKFHSRLMEKAPPNIIITEPSIPEKTSQYDEQISATSLANWAIFSIGLRTLRALQQSCADRIESLGIITSRVSAFSITNELVELSEKDADNIVEYNLENFYKSLIIIARGASEANQARARMNIARASADVVIRASRHLGESIWQEVADFCDSDLSISEIIWAEPIPDRRSSNRKPPGVRLRRTVQIMLNDDDYLRLLEISSEQTVSNYCRKVLRDHLAGVG